MRKYNELYTNDIKEICPNIQPETTENDSVATKEGVRLGD
jgi:hypothetical protein